MVDTCAAYNVTVLELNNLSGWDDQHQSFCPSGTDLSPGWRLGRLCGAQQGGAGYGATPPSRPPLHPPRSTPKENFQIPENGEGTRLELRELPSLAALSQVISHRAA